MIFLVLFTVIIHGSFMPLFARCLLGSKEEVHNGKRVLMTQRTYGDKPEASSSSVNTSSLIENGEVKEKLIN